MIMLSEANIKNLVAVIIGIICSRSVLLSKIAEELKDEYSKGNELSKIKRITRFLKSKSFNAETVYFYFLQHFFEQFKTESSKMLVIIDHTTIFKKFTVLQFSLRFSGRAIPLCFRIFLYKDKQGKSFEEVKEGLRDIEALFRPYNFKVTILADRWFRSIDLFKFIDQELKWKYCIRSTGNTLVNIDNNKKILKLGDIKPKGTIKRCYKQVSITKEKYVCNLGVASLAGKSDKWYIITNDNPLQAILDYSKRFDIEELFRDLKSNGFNMEDTQTNDLIYFKNLYLCLCIAYIWMIILGKTVSKNKKSKELGATRITGERKITKIYSYFMMGLKWFKKSYYSDRRAYYLRFDFSLYNG